MEEHEQEQPTTPQAKANHRGVGGVHIQHEHKADAMISLVK